MASTSLYMSLYSKCVCSQSFITLSLYIPNDSNLLDSTIPRPYIPRTLSSQRSIFSMHCATNVIVPKAPYSEGFTFWMPCISNSRLPRAPTSKLLNITCFCSQNPMSPKLYINNTCNLRLCILKALYFQWTYFLRIYIPKTIHFHDSIFPVPVLPELTGQNLWCLYITYTCVPRALCLQSTIFAVLVFPRVSFSHSYIFPRFVFPEEHKTQLRKALYFQILESDGCIFPRLVFSGMYVP